MMNIVLATRNHNKVKELKELLSDLPVQVLCCTDFPGCPEVHEDGATLVENALKKARTVATCTGLPALADDSGLEVDALGGAPGVISSRYGGVEGDAQRNIARLLKELKGIPEKRRTARFRCVIAFVIPGTHEYTVEGVCHGRIIEAPRGTAGFGYDPVFLDEESGLTFAEMEAQQKNSISHRGKAMQELKKLLHHIIRQ
ncbi:MAG: XTP/dITP diphosphatase [Desulfobacterota bacterium]|nr:XTP/dITP diphosphatase [Thermodesulfobacteriota bacterium]